MGIKEEENPAMVVGWEVEEGWAAFPRSQPIYLWKLQLEICLECVQKEAPGACQEQLDSAGSSECCGLPLDVSFGVFPVLPRCPSCPGLVVVLSSL